MKQNWRLFMSLFFLFFLHVNLKAQEQEFVHFPTDSGNTWIYRIDTNIGVSGKDSMRVIGKRTIEDKQYYLFDKFLPLFNLTQENIDSVLVRETGGQVFIRVDSVDYLWYDFNLSEGDTFEIVIPEIIIEQDTFKLLTWKESYGPVFTPENDTVYEVTVFRFRLKSNTVPFAACDYFLPPWGLVSHIVGGVDPVTYNLTNAFVSGQLFERNVVSVQTPSAPRSFQLQQNYPNPFNPETTIEYSLSKAADVALVIYSTRGQHVKTLLDVWQMPGKHTVHWDGTDDSRQAKVASGLYIYELKVDANLTRRKMLLLR